MEYPKKYLIQHILDNKRRRRFSSEIRGYRNAQNRLPENFNEEARLKGFKFESFVVRHFDTEYFTLVEWRSDKSVDNIMPVMNIYPDLEFYFQSSSHEIYFAVECKWREGFSDSRVYLGKNQHNNYRDYQAITGYPTFLILGIGNTPENPNAVYIIPVEHLDSHVLHEFDLLKFERRNPSNNFYLDCEAGVLL